jgi:hypothetical protein
VAPMIDFCAGVQHGADHARCGGNDRWTDGVSLLRGVSGQSVDANFVRQVVDTLVLPALRL